MYYRGSDLIPNLEDPGSVLQILAYYIISFGVGRVIIYPIFSYLSINTSTVVH